MENDLTGSSGPEDSSRYLETEQDIIAMDGAGQGICHKYTCAILWPPDYPTQIGSGTVVTIGDHALVATAAHVVESVGTRDLVLAGWYDWDTRRFPIPQGGFRIQGGPDVAFLILEKSVLESARIEGLPLNRLEMDVVHRSDSLFLVCGTPGKEVGLKEMPASLSLTYRHICCKTMRCADWPLLEKPARPDRDIFLHYGRDVMYDNSGNRVPVIDPRGMSGGGIWRVPLDSDGSLWSPNQSRLVGIQTSMESEGWKWLHGVQIRCWLRLVWDTYPILRREIAAAGFSC